MGANELGVTERFSSASGDCYFIWRGRIRILRL
jgi:hypothetical protein